MTTNTISKLTSALSSIDCKEKDENPIMLYCKDPVQWFKERTVEIFKALIFVFLKEFC